MFAIERLIPPSQPSGEKEDEEGCGGALERVQNLTLGELGSWDLYHYIAADCNDSCSAVGLKGWEWNVTTNDLGRPVLSQLLSSVHHITRALNGRERLARNHFTRHLDGAAFQAELPDFLDHLSSYWRDSVQLLSLGVEHLSQLIVPLAFEYTAHNMTDQRIRGWIKDMEHARDMLHTKLRGWVRDAELISEQIRNYKLEEDKNRPGKYFLRRPLLSDALLEYTEHLPSFSDSFSAPCEQRQADASRMLHLADAVYSFYRTNWLRRLSLFSVSAPPYINITDEEWQLEDRSDAMLSVDTCCLQLLVKTVDHPRCPLEDLPVETIEQRRQCLEQLWDDMVQRWPHIPVTSYLAYTQRVGVSLCLLAWMAASSCQDVPSSMMQSLHDARCYFESSDNHSCLKLNAKNTICSVSRATLFLKCQDYIYSKSPNVCVVYFSMNRNLSSLPDFKIKEIKPADKSLNYKYSLNTDLLKYRDFKIDSLKSLENSLISVNIFFRFLTAAVYVYLPHLRNLPGKILLSFQMTCILQILFSEVVYRTFGVPGLPITVLVDSALTLLGCLWLNSFCYQMYACVRHLRLPNDLLPSETRKVFCCQLLYVLTPWTILCAATISLEISNKNYLIHSRVIFIAVISVSIFFNLVCLGLVDYMYRRTKKSMHQLRIYSNNKSYSKKEILYVSVKTAILSGIGVIIRIGFHQAKGIAQFVYYVHLTTMVQGPVLFVLFICNETTLPVLRERVLAWRNADVIRPGEELCSAAERNLAKRGNGESDVAESSL